MQLCFFIAIETYDSMTQRAFVKSARINICKYAWNTVSALKVLAIINHRHYPKKLVRLSDRGHLSHAIVIPNMSLVTPMGSTDISMFV